MPMKWSSPDAYLEHRNVYIHHCYKNEDHGNQMTCWFTTDPNEEKEFEFDVREVAEKLLTRDEFNALPLLWNHDKERVRKILRAAIDGNLLRLPEGTKKKPEGVMKVRKTFEAIYRIEFEHWTDEDPEKTMEWLAIPEDPDDRPHCITSKKLLSSKLLETGGKP